MTAARVLAPSPPPVFQAPTGVTPPPSRREWDTYLSSHGRSFWLAARLIPQPRRAQLAGVYAYCRYTDDLVDNATGSPDETLAALEQWESLSRDAYNGRETGVELLDVVIGEMGRARVPFAYAEGLIRGMRADATDAHYETLAQLEQYCHDVASVVGLWLTELFGVRDRWMLDRAARLGVGMQLTNIVRDVGEDWDRGRLYLPQSMLDAHGVTHEMIVDVRHGTAPVPANYAALIEELIAAAERAYMEGGEAIEFLPDFFRPAVAVASRVYRGIHDAIRANAYDSIRRRAVTSDADKVSLTRAALATLATTPGADEQVVVVDALDHEMGTLGKLEAHRRGVLHRAFSVVIENDRGELLLQRRAAHKYHSPGLWSNACCGHPRPGESIEHAAQRRVEQELGVLLELHEIGTFTYRSPVGDLIEHEIDHVFAGRMSREPEPNPAEVSECRWAKPADLRAALCRTPAEYTPWLRGVMQCYDARLSPPSWHATSVSVEVID